MSDDKKKTWHGIAREEIPWLPTVDAGRASVASFAT